MATGLYAALAASASVFIGILTALLASNLSNLNAQRERIGRRIETIDARLANLDDQYEQFKGTLEEIQQHWEENERRERAEEQVENFIEEHVGEEFDVDPDDLTGRMLQREFESYLDVERLNEEQHNALQEHFEEIQDELTTSHGMFSAPVPGGITDPAIIASNNQIEQQWQIHTNQRYNRNYRRWVQTKTEIQSLQDERERLKGRYESLDPSRIRGSLRATVATIGLSVGIPLLAYLFRVLDIILIPGLQPWVEPTIVFVIWLIGLAIVFLHLRGQLDEDIEDLSEAPDMTVDEDGGTLD